MDFLSTDLQKYVSEHTEAEDELLQKITRETYAKVLNPRMVSGHLQGRFLSMVAHMIQPNCILEIGTFTGYSALCMAEALTKNGKLITIDINEELEDRTRSFLGLSPLSNKIEYIVGDAALVIPQLEPTFDMVFIDADKFRYSLYFDLVIDKVRSGGFILVDNVLWSGKVLANEVEHIDKDTRAILAFNKKVNDDARVANVLLPIRDGIMMLRKK
jgi:caffeoyl-CoA O-methyltransferase